jgi:CDP-diglyceride synthetase
MVITWYDIIMVTLCTLCFIYGRYAGIYERSGLKCYSWVWLSNAVAFIGVMTAILIWKQEPILFAATCGGIWASAAVGYFVGRGKNEVKESDS